ncbi:MAG: type II secretion system F family protein [Bdellovibrionales bacterium]|nr:type II secretion system F family protein [Bdellovibrionales bacterium]
MSPQFQPEDNQFDGHSFSSRRALSPDLGLAVAFSNFATLAEAGLPILRSLKIIQRQAIHPEIEAALGDVCDEIESGSTLSEGMAKVGRPFSGIDISITKAAENIGAIDVVLKSLAANKSFCVADLSSDPNLELSPEMRRYSHTLGTLIGAGVPILEALKHVEEISSDPLKVATKVVSETIKQGYSLAHGFNEADVPMISDAWIRIVDIGEENGLIDRLLIQVAELPHVTQILAAGLQNDPTNVNSVVNRVASLQQFFDRDFGSEMTATLTPDLRKYSHALGTCVQLGIPILDALKVAASGLSEDLMAMSEKAAEGIRQGESLSRSFKEHSPDIHPLWLTMVDVGEETGDLDIKLIEAARSRLW